MNTRLTSLAAISLIAAGLAFPALAQDKKATEPLVSFNIPLDNCVKPQIPEKKDSAAKQKQFPIDMDNYRGCLSDYTAGLRRYAEAHNKAAAAYINAANLAIEEYNAYIKSVSETTAEKKKP